MPPDRAWTDEYTLLCERCGYVVEGLPTEGACPECGKAIAESLPERRVGTAWQRRATARTAIRTWLATLAAPRRTLAQMRFEPRSASGLRRRALWASAAMLSSSVLVFGFAALVVLAEQPKYRHPIESSLGVVMAAGITLIASFVVLHGLTRIEMAGLMFLGSRRGFRISSAVAGAVCDHACVGWLVASAGALLGVIFVLVGGSLSFRYESSSGYDPKLASALFGLGLGLGAGFVVIGFLFFETFAYLGLRRCKYANRARPEGAPSAATGPAPGGAGAPA